MENVDALLDAVHVHRRPDGWKLTGSFDTSALNDDAYRGLSVRAPMSCPSPWSAMKWRSSLFMVAW